MSHQERAAALRAAAARETQGVDDLLAKLSDPRLKERIALLRRDLVEFEPVFLRDLPSSSTPEVLVAAAELWLQGLTRMREEYERLIERYGPSVKLVR